MKRNLENSTPTFNKTKFEQQQARSGGELPILYIALVDKYGAIVGTENNQKLRVTIDETYKSNLSSMVYTPNVAGTTEYYS